MTTLQKIICLSPEFTNLRVDGMAERKKTFCEAQKRIFMCCTPLQALLAAAERIFNSRACRLERGD